MGKNEVNFYFLLKTVAVSIWDQNPIVLYKKLNSKSFHWSFLVLNMLNEFKTCNFYAENKVPTDAKGIAQ